MGGQACILYGAAEFSRDADLAILAEPDNLRHLASALDELAAIVTAVPPFEGQYLERGHAIHFRAERDDVRGLRVDVMSRMRGVDPFPQLWARRTILQLPDARGATFEIDVMALPDLVMAKKTQRDRDWPMIRRLVEVNYFQFRDEPTPTRASFWLRELRTPELLIEAVRAFPDVAQIVAAERAVAMAAISGDLARIEAGLAAEQAREREADRAYWAPLRGELERLRHEQRGRRGP